MNDNKIRKTDFNKNKQNINDIIQLFFKVDDIDKRTVIYYLQQLEKNPDKPIRNVRCVTRTGLSV